MISRRAGGKKLDLTNYEFFFDGRFASFSMEMAIILPIVRQEETRQGTRPRA